MTPIWNDEIERIKQDPDASVFLVSFASQNEAKSTIYRLSFARQITKDGKTGLALPGHIIFKVGKSAEGKLWILLAGRMSTDESLEAYELFGVHGSEQIIVLPSRVESRITGIAATPFEIAPAQEPAKVTTMQAPAEVKVVQKPGKVLSAQEPVVAKSTQEPAETKPAPVVVTPPQKPIEVASMQAPVEVTKAQESTVVAPAKAAVEVTPAPEPVVVKAPQTSAEIKPVPVVVTAAQPPAKVAAVQEPAKVVSAPEPGKVTPTPVTTTAQSQKEDKRTPPPTAPASDDQTATRIYLARQGEREGPFTLEHIKAQIMTGRYKDDDFWAWHDGLPEWIPLYKIPGVGKPANGKSESA